MYGRTDKHDEDNSYSSQSCNFTNAPKNFSVHANVQISVCTLMSKFFLYISETRLQLRKCPSKLQLLPHSKQNVNLKDKQRCALQVVFRVSWLLFTARKVQNTETDCEGGKRAIFCIKLDGAPRMYHFDFIPGCHRNMRLFVCFNAT